MQLDVSRFFSHRLIFDDALPEKLWIASSFWDWCKRIISWVFSIRSYSDENRRTVACFKKYLLDILGKGRLQRICTRYRMDLDAMEKKGSPLLSRDVAKIVIGTKNITIEDLNESFPDKNFQELDVSTLARTVEHLSNPFNGSWKVADIAKRISGGPTEWIARMIYDPFLADRERLQESRKHATDRFETFMHNMVALVIKREMDVGTLIPAPNHPDGHPQFYYVSAKLITGEGMVSYLFHPATKDTNLEPLRLFRGTAARNSEIDGISTVITDFERDLGRSAYESGQAYEAIIQERLDRPRVEGGHSLGSALVQYRLANMDHIRKAYLYCGPGLPEKEMEKFNRKNPQVHLLIRHSTRDKWSGVGEAHLGYKAPSAVHLDFWKYHPPRKMVGSSHVAVWGRERVRYGIEGGMDLEKTNRQLYFKDSFKERLRSTFGPLIACALRSVRDGYRRYFSSRAETERGLKIGHLQNGRWRVDHFRPIPYNIVA